MNLRRLDLAGALCALLLATSCKDERVGTMESDLQAMRGQVQQLQAQLAEQANQQLRSEAQMVEWLDATSRQLDRFLDKIGAPPVEPAAAPEAVVPATTKPTGGEATAPAVPPDTTDAATVPPESSRPASVGPTALLVTLLLLAACAGIGFAALRTLRRDADPTVEPVAPAPVDDGHTKLLASLTEWEQQHAPAPVTPVADANVVAEVRGEEAVPIAAVHPETDDLETPAHHAGPAVVEPEAAAPQREPEVVATEVEHAGAATPAEPAVVAAAPAPVAESAPEAVPVAITPVAEVVAPAEPPAPPPVRRASVVEHEVPGRIAVDTAGALRPAGPEPVRLPGPPRARFRAMTSSPEDAAVALAAILQIDPRVMRRPAPTVSTTATTVVAEYSLVPALPPGERGDLEARLWQAVGEARKHGSQPLPSV